MRFNSVDIKLEIIGYFAVGPASVSKHGDSKLGCCQGVGHIAVQCLSLYLYTFNNFLSSSGLFEWLRAASLVIMRWLTMSMRELLRECIP